ncbi:cell division protein FtsQ [Marinobacterium zhoushanense]|uniref:Cell division protein FtsQ n=1 Tax=Marinobacterium zhoushanense TaxID=1679163 RepID=A0ABQ1K891_9GAMM|nr:cell division protein FtsQ/DivIB [Marinobacterium zhoushanense]GGB87640.1 cell division protein FtsQ [Marinobacterium zhoushanense]
MLMTLPWRNRTPELAEVEPVRGAARAAAMEPNQQDGDWYWRPLVLLTLLVVFAGIVTSAGRDLWRWLDKPVAEIRIAGAVRHLDKQVIAQGLAASIDSTLLDLDLQRLRDQIIREPWVHDATISRQWPPALQVDVVEEVPVARWGDKGLLNHQGDIFWPELKPEYVSLPKLSGPAHETVRIMEQFHDLTPMFAANGLKLSGLTLEPRGAWTIDLDNGIRVVAGREQLIPRLKRFLAVYRLTLASRAAEIEQIDIRYPNGVAVRWRAVEKSENAG